MGGNKISSWTPHLENIGEGVVEPKMIVHYRWVDYGGVEEAKKP